MVVAVYGEVLAAVLVDATVLHPQHLQQEQAGHPAKDKQYAVVAVLLDQVATPPVTGNQVLTALIIMEDKAEVVEVLPFQQHRRLALAAVEEVAAVVAAVVVVAALD